MRLLPRPAFLVATVLFLATPTPGRAQTQGRLRVSNPSPHTLCRITLVRDDDGERIEALTSDAELSPDGAVTVAAPVGLWRVEGRDCRGVERLRYDGESRLAPERNAGREVPAGRVEQQGALERVSWLRIHRPTYFITGFDNDTQAKFQLSFRFDLLPNHENWSLFFAYTQLSFWNIYSESEPFLENNYSPELFVRWRPFGELVRTGFDQFFFGYTHESNGEDGDLTRSWDRVFAEARFVHYFGDPQRGAGAFRGYLRLWVIAFRETQNDDIYDFAGPGELILALDSGRTVAGQLLGDVAIRKGLGSRFEQGRMQVSLSWFPPWPRDFPLTLGLHAQAHFGYLESLEAYDVPRDRFRIGLLFRG